LSPPRSSPLSNPLPTFTGGGFAEYPREQSTRSLSLMLHVRRDLWR
jgi:hypothetical protein